MWQYLTCCISIYILKFFDVNLKNFIRLGATFFYPSLCRLFHIKTVDDTLEKFILKIVGETIAHRENGKIDKKDFFQLLLQLKHHGTMHGDKNNWSVGNETGSYDTVDSCNWRIFLSSRVI